MAVKKGQYAKVMMDVDGTPVEVMKLRSWAISITSNKIDSTATQQEWETHEVGHKKWTGDATCIDADPFWFAHLGDKVAIEFYDDADDLAPAFTGTASVDVDRSVPHDNLIETSFTFEGDGELVEGTPPAI